MASRGRGRRGRPRGTGQAPPAFDQPRLLISRTLLRLQALRLLPLHRLVQRGSQGGLSNLQRFRAHHPPKFTGGGDPMVTDHWFMQIEKVLEAMEITSDTTRIR